MQGPLTCVAFLVLLTTAQADETVYKHKIQTDQEASIGKSEEGFLGWSLNVLSCSEMKFCDCAEQCHAVGQDRS